MTAFQKRHYQIIAEHISLNQDMGLNENSRELIISFMEYVFIVDNPRFDSIRFREWIKRRLNDEPLKGMRYNPKFMLDSA